MKSFGVMVMRNEVDVLESWVRYHAQVFDGLIVADHLSIDGSLELARELKDEGLPIDILTVEEVAYEQSSVVTHLARRAASHGADWVFPLDADEFLNTQGDPLTDGLVEAEALKPFSMPWQTYVPTPRDPPDEAIVPLRMTWRLTEEIVPYTKVAIPGHLLKHPGTTVGPGSHELLDAGIVVTAAAFSPGWSNAHFPVRSIEQLARKVFVGWISLLAKPDKGPRTSYQWKHWYDVLVDADFETLDATEVAMTYLVDSKDVNVNVGLVHDPLPHHLCDFDLRAPAQDGVSPLKALASVAESVAAELGRLRGTFPVDPGRTISSILSA